ncbi:hypothetical protein T439DRAFT_338536 [Meredithblackwellia eburnea MCA 4105]
MGGVSTVPTLLRRQNMMNVPIPPPPDYEDLPECVPGYPVSWTYFNSVNEVLGGSGRDQLGTLNFLSPERLAEAAKSEIQLGKSITLDAPVDYLTKDISAFGGRSAPIHTIDIVAPNGREDSLTLNTQSSSQWDGLKHFGIAGANLFYNGYTPSDLETTDVLGTHVWCERGGISGRAVLVDFYSWALSRGEDIDVNSGRQITLEEVLAVLESQETSVRPGDVLVFRTGFMLWYEQCPPTKRHEQLCIKHAPGSHNFIGLKAERNFVAWLWNNQIAAVAGDQVAFESTPPPPPGGFGWLHEHLLAALGCPIGELWNLEELAEECKRLKRYSFFLTSMPLHVRGGVASPANALAIL